MAEVRKRHFPAEAKMVYQWAVKTHPYALQWRRVRVGKIPDEKQSKIYFQLRRYVDLLFYENGTVHLVEAKVRPDPGGIAQLELYKKLFPETPEFSQYANQPIKLIYLTSFKDDVVKEMCKEKDIAYHVFCPDWMTEYLKKRIFKI